MLWGLENGGKSAGGSREPGPWPGKTFVVICKTD